MYTICHNSYPFSFNKDIVCELRIAAIIGFNVTCSITDVKTSQKQSNLITNLQIYFRVGYSPFDAQYQR